jgi:nucleoside phosphorylase
MSTASPYQYDRHEYGRKEYSSKKLTPKLTNPPDLPVINWELVGLTAPVLVKNPGSGLPKADIVVITWVEAEWAALEHVFCQSKTRMAYADRNGHWIDGRYEGWRGEWIKVEKNSSRDEAESGEWGYCRLLETSSPLNEQPRRKQRGILESIERPKGRGIKPGPRNKKILLFKSSAHLHTTGEYSVIDMVGLLLDKVQPELILTIGTAGGARTTDKEGTVNVVNKATRLYVGKDGGEEYSPVCSSNWQPTWDIINDINFKELLTAIPVQDDDLNAMHMEFNTAYDTAYSLNELDEDNLDEPDSPPKINNLAEEGTSLLTTDTFVVGNTSWNYKDYAFIEMDDYYVFKTVSEYNTKKSANVLCGSVRNISDPVQNVNLSQGQQSDWGGVIYSDYGFYTSNNGAIAAFALVAGYLGDNKSR